MGLSARSFCFLSGHTGAEHRHRGALLAHANPWPQHFENHVVGVVALPQPVEWKIDSIGMFLQLSLKFGPYSVIDVH